MKAKDYLEQIRNTRTMLELKLEEKKEQKATIENVKGMQITERVQTSPKNDAMDNAILKLNKIDDDINRTIDKLRYKIKEVEDTIDRVKDIKHHEVLFRRYVLNQKWEQIAVCMNYDMRWVQKLHGRALQEVDKMINKP